MAEAFAAAAAVLVAPLLYAEYRRHQLRGVAKAAASSAFVAAGFAAGALDGAYGRWLLAGLVLSWIGDLALVSAARRWFLVGLASFLLAHAAYLAGFSSVEGDLRWAAAAAGLLVIPAVAIGWWLHPAVPTAMRVPVGVYIVVISAMVAAAVGGGAGAAPPVVIPAAVAFYVSDVFVARDRFVAPAFVNRMIGLPLYYGAQIALALSTGMV